MVAVGEPTYASDLNVWSAAPLVRLVQTTAQTNLAHDTPVPIVFPNEDYDSNGWHDTVTNNTRITVGQPGYYDIRGAVSFATQSNYTLLIAYPRINSTTAVPAGGRQAYAGTLTESPTINCSARVALNASDYVELIGQHKRASAATTNLVSGGAVSSFLELAFVRPL